MKKRGRKKIEVDWELLDNLLKYSANCVMASDVLGVSADTIERRIKEKFGMTFEQYKSSKLSHTKVKLATKAINEALSGNTTMLIFCLKNLNRWTDNIHVENKIKVERVANMSDTELEIEARKIINARVLDEPKRTGDDQDVDEE